MKVSTLSSWEERGGASTHLHAFMHPVLLMQVSQRSQTCVCVCASFSAWSSFPVMSDTRPCKWALPPALPSASRTLKSMPTVEMKLPARKAPSLKRTNTQVLPTPESPTSITCRRDKGECQCQVRPQGGAAMQHTPQHDGQRHTEQETRQDSANLRGLKRSCVLGGVCLYCLQVCKCLTAHVNRFGVHLTLCIFTTHNQ